MHIVERQTNMVLLRIICHSQGIRKTAQKMCRCLPFSMFERDRLGCWMPAPQATNGVTVSWSMPVPWEPQSVIPWSLVYTNTVLPSSRKYLYSTCTQNLYYKPAHLINAIASTGSLYSNLLYYAHFFTSSSKAAYHHPTDLYLVRKWYPPPSLK